MRYEEAVILALLTLFSIGVIALLMFAERDGDAFNAAEGPPGKPNAAVSLPLLHTVEKGETLGGISQKYYGTTQKWALLLEANDDILQSPENLRPNMVLLIPELNSPPTP